MRHHGRFVKTAALLAALLISACGAEREPTTSRAQTGPVPASPQRPGDPERGYRIVVEGGYMSCGIPYSAWLRTAKAATADAPRLTDRRGRNADMPYFLTLESSPQGVPIVTNNCLTCHAASFDGRLIIGLGNESLDFTIDPRETVDAVGMYLHDPGDVQAWQHWGERLTAIAPYMITDTIGVNPAPNLTLALIAHRHPRTLAWLDQPGLEPPPRQPLPVSVPPWWRMARKHAMFYNAMGRGDHARFMMMKSLVCSDTVAEAETIDERFPDVRAYIASLRPPTYPFRTDPELARQGEAVFRSHCQACHGSYGPSGSYPNLVIGLDQVGTDPEYALAAHDRAQRFMDWFNNSWYGTIASARPAPGYVAPPLDGIWATAPYLHNGSVPTLQALLDSRLRPTFWSRSFDSEDFDEQAVGWHYRVLETGKAQETDPGLRKRIYDTTLPGYANTGHLFGDHLEAGQRRAVIEYLKTL